MSPESKPKATRDELITFIDDVCLRDGAVNEWKHENCDEFLNMTDEQTVVFVKAIIRSDVEGINKICFDSSLSDDEKISRVRAHIEGPLEFLFEGRMGFNQNGKLVFCKPTGYRPDEQMKIRFEEWLKRSFPLITQALAQCANKK